MPTPLPNTALNLVAASLRSAPYAGQLFDVLAHPVAASRPDLRHFQAPGSPSPVFEAAAPASIGGGPPGPAGVARRGGRGLLLVLLLAAALAALLPLRLVVTQRRRGPATMIALAVLALASDGVATAPSPHPAVTLTTVQPAAAPPALPAPAAAGPPPTAPAIWTQLVGVEGRLGEDTALLAGQEWEIHRLATLVGRHVDDPDLLPVGEDSPVQMRTRLSTALAAHQAAAAAYDHDLQSEYELYLAASRDPALRSMLVSAAARFPNPDGPVAVNADLGLLDTQLAQEAAVAAAQAQLRQISVLLPSQLAAIRRHRVFIAPEIADVTQGFGPTDLDIEPPLLFGGTFYPHFHTGIDIAGPDGTPLHAAADGVVLLAASSVDSAGHLTGYGNYVVIGHAAGFLTLYGHMSQVAVHAGDRVRQGQVIGFEGSTGNSTGPHVHFEIRRDGDLLDPAPFLAGQLAPPDPSS